MLIPTTPAVLEKIRNGRETVSIWPFAPDALPLVGDVVTFREGAFDVFGRPVGYIENGASVSVVLTKAADTKESHGEATLVQLEWRPPTKS